MIKTINTPIKTVVEPKKLLNKENRILLFILILYSVGAGISLYIKDYSIRESDKINSVSEESNKAFKDLPRNASILKLIILFGRLFLSRGLGGVVASYSIFVNLIIILLIQGATTLETLETGFNRILSVFGFEQKKMELSGVLISLSEIDFWIHIIGGINSLAPLPGIINSILAISIVMTQLSIN